MFEKITQKEFDTITGRKYNSWAAVLPKINGAINLFADQHGYRVNKSSFDVSSIDAEISFSVGARLNIKIKNRYAVVDGEIVAEGKTLTLRTIEAEINWSSTGRNVSKALACIAVYEQMINFAAKLEAIFDDTYWQVS